MSFIKLTQMSDTYMVSSNLNFEEEYMAAERNCDEDVRRVLNNNWYNWRPLSLTKSIIINSDCIESVREEYCCVAKIRNEFRILLPSISEVTLKSGEKYTVWEDVGKIEKLICEKCD